MTFEVKGNRNYAATVIRVERSLQPEFFKIKNKSHYEYETKQLDTGEVDMESAS